MTWILLTLAYLDLLSALVPLSPPHFIPNEQPHKKKEFDFSLLLSISWAPLSFPAPLEDIRVYHVARGAAASDL